MHVARAGRATDAVELAPPGRAPPPPAHPLTHLLAARSNPPPQALMRAQLERIKGAEGLSENVFEIVSKSLKD